MKVPYRPRKVKYVSARDQVTSFAGLKPLFDLAHRLGILKDLQSLTVKRRRRGIPIVDFVMSLVANFVVGGECMTDLKQLRDEDATRSLLYGLEVPAPTTTGETLRKFTLGHIRQIERVIGRALKGTRDMISGSESITLDGDSSVFEVHGYHKEGARYAYNQVRGFHPLLAFWSEKRLLMGLRLRPGNRHTCYKATSFLAECLGRLPKDHSINGRFDSGFYSRGIVEFCLRHHMGFTISAKLFEGLVERISEIEEDAWKSYPWEEKAQWTEFSYLPAHWPRPFRMLVKRVPFYEKEQLILGKYFYTAVITNRRGMGSSLLRFHLARGGTENYIEEFKSGIGARLVPTQRFLANWAWLVIAQLAYNLVQCFKLLLMPRQQHSFQMKRLRLLWFNVAARIVHSGRRLILHLARGPDAAERFDQVQNAIALELLLSIAFCFQLTKRATIPSARDALPSGRPTPYPWIWAKAMTQG
jgi:hypothetical protein